MASVVDGANTRQYNMTVMQGLKLASARRVMAGTVVLLATEAPVQYFDLNGAARNLDLPAEETNEGLTFFIRNITGTAQTLTIRNDAGSTITTLAQNTFAVLHCDGVSWRVIG